MISIPVGFVVASLIVFVITVVYAVYWRRDCLEAESSLKFTEKALKSTLEVNARLNSTIEEYGADRVRRGDELAEMGGKIAWFTHFLEHIENPPVLFAPLIGHRWRLVSTIAVATIREVLGEISGDWVTFELALFKEAARRREASAKVRPKRIVGRRVAK